MMVSACGCSKIFFLLKTFFVFRCFPVRLNETTMGIHNKNRHASAILLCYYNMYKVKNAGRQRNAVK